MWLWLSFGAAVLWGLDYAITGQVLKKISFPTLISIELLCGFLVMLVITLVTKSWKADFSTILSSRSLFILIAIITVSFAVANLLITASIQQKGASIASIIEISYPFFVVIFTGLIFKENDLNAATMIGGVLVFLGVSVIYLFNK
jgi:drug/metabolite transporter (DMT)-like permease